jgi:hypothetical protein
MAKVGVPEPLISPTTLGSYIGMFGTLMTGVGFFWPPALLIGATISGLAKLYTGHNTADAVVVDALVEKLPEARTRLIT